MIPGHVINRIDKLECPHIDVGYCLKYKKYCANIAMCETKNPEEFKATQAAEAAAARAKARALAKARQRSSAAWRNRKKDRHDKLAAISSANLHTGGGKSNSVCTF